MDVRIVNQDEQHLLEGVVVARHDDLLMREIAHNLTAAGEALGLPADILE